MRWSGVVILFILISPAVQAGTRDDPELTDPEGDVQRWPGVPTADPSSDFISVWFHEDAENLYLSMEVVEHTTYDPEFSNVIDTTAHLMGAHVNGEGEQTPCSGWGAFTVRDHYDEQVGWRASLRIYWPMEQQTDGCNGDDYDVNVTVEDDVVTMAVPWVLLAGHVQAGDELTVSDARAWSGSTYPATPNDYADDLPGRPYLVEHGAPVAATNATPAPTTTGPADPAMTHEDPGGDEAAPGDQEAPTTPWIVVVAALVASAARRRSR